MLRASASTIHRARKQRREMSLPEILLWRELKLRPGGVKFRKQHPVGLLVLDFFCAEAKVAIEVDGEAHNRADHPDFDANRGAWLRLHGIDTVRIPASAILTDLEAAVVHILETVRARLPLHRPADGPPPRPGEDYRKCP